MEMQRPAAGFSLVELMIALLLTSLLTAGIGQIFLGNGRTHRLQDNLGRLLENGRYALETVQLDLRRAGYLGLVNGAGIIVDDTTGGVRNGRRTATEDGTCRDIRWVRMLSHPLFGLDDRRGGYDCLPRARVHTGDVLVTRYARPLHRAGITRSPSRTALHPDHLYLRSSLSAGTLFEGRQAMRNPPAGSVTAELVAHGYFIRPRHAPAADNCPGSRTIPALYRVMPANGRLVAREVARGIEQFQVQYGIDTNRDGTVDRFVDAMTAGDPRWREITAVRIWILARAECPESGYSNTRRYVMGNITVVPALADRDRDGRIDGDVDGDGDDDYRRRLFMATVSLRNI